MKILFRGLRADGRGWVYGDVQHNLDCIKIREQEKEGTVAKMQIKVVNMLDGTMKVTQ